MAQENIQHEPWAGVAQLEKTLVMGYVGKLSEFVEQLDRQTRGMAPSDESTIEQARRLVR